MKIYQVFIFSISILVLGAGCKNDEKTDTGPVPVISFVSISPSTVKQYTDSIIIKVSYTDGDGDLGENTSGVTNAFVTDSRSNLIYGFRIRQLAPDNSPISLKGSLEIEVPATALLDGNNSEETLTYKVFVKDRAGNSSNTITTSSIRVIE